MLRGALFDVPFTVRNLDNFLTTSGLEKPKMRTEEKKMNEKEGAMNGNCQAGMSARKFIAAALALSFFMLSADVYGKQKKGATVIITLRDGRTASGELIAVKPKSILILDPVGKDASFDLTEIAVVKVFRKSKAGKGALTGFLIGAGVGITAGILSAGSGEDSDFQGRMAAMFLGGIGGVVGLVGGLLAGASASGELDIRFEGATELSQRADLQKLTKYARYMEFR
jgi:hypothetical protein